MTDAPRRKPFSKDAKIAALASIVFDIPYEHQKDMHEDQVQMLLEWHHNIRHAEGGTEHFSNAVPMLVAAHRERTAKIDVPEIAKNKRIRNKEMVRHFNAAAKVDPDAAAQLYPAVARLKARRKSKIPQRVNPWQPGRKLQSRGFQRRQP